MHTHNNKVTAVFHVIASLHINQVIQLNITIPLIKERNRAGQNWPLNAETAEAVANMNIHVIGTPIKRNTQLYCFSEGQTIGPFI